MTLDDLARAVPPSEDEWSDAFDVVSQLRDVIGSLGPPHLADVSGEWRDPYLELGFAHTDGSDLAVVHGDGYTQITGGPVNYGHYLEAEDLIAVLTAAMTGDLQYVARHRLGRVTDDWFVIRGRAGRVGSDPLNLGSLLNRVPGHDAFVRVSFADPRGFMSYGARERPGPAA